MATFLTPPPPTLQDFTNEILWLIQRYITSSQGITKEYIPINNHQTLHSTTLKSLIETYQITHSYYSSPLTCPITLTNYNSPHNTYIIFSPTAYAHSSKGACNGLTYPPYHIFATMAIHWACMVAKEDHNATTITELHRKENPFSPNT